MSFTQMRIPAIIPAVVFLLGISSCDKVKTDCSDVVKELGVASTSSPDTIHVGEAIKCNLTVYYYEYARQVIHEITVSPTTNNNFEIKVNAKFPGCDPVSLPYIWNHDTSVLIPAPATGTYILHFSGLNSSIYDTVRVVD